MVSGYISLLMAMSGYRKYGYIDGVRIHMDTGFGQISVGLGYLVLIGVGYLFIMAVGVGHETWVGFGYQEIFGLQLG